MQPNSMAKNAAYVGAGAGLTLFVMIGLLPGSFLGGALGITLSKWISGSPLQSELLPRIIVALSMFLGVLISGTIFLMSGTFIGWMVGRMIEAVPIHAYFSGSRKTKQAAGNDHENKSESK